MVDQRAARALDDAHALAAARAAGHEVAREDGRSPAGRGSPPPRAPPRSCAPSDTPAWRAPARRCPATNSWRRASASGVGMKSQFCTRASGPTRYQPRSPAGRRRRCRGELHVTPRPHFLGDQVVVALGAGPIEDDAPVASRARSTPPYRSMAPSARTSDSMFDRKLPKLSCSAGLASVQPRMASATASVPSQYLVHVALQRRGRHG